MSRIPHRSRGHAFNPGAALTMLFVLAACGGDDTPTDPGDGECGWTGGGASSYTLGVVGPTPLPYTGTQTRWDPNLRLISLGPEEVGEAEPDLAITMTIAEPETVSFGCGAVVTWANLVAHDVQVGTGDEIGAQYFELIPGDCAGDTVSGVKIESIGRDAIVVSGFCLTMQRIIAHPNGSTERGEVVTLRGEFTAVAP